MSWKRLGAVCLTLALAAPVAAQRGQGRARGMGMRAGQGTMQNGAQHAKGPAQLLSLRMTLELSDDQVAQLETLQEGFVEQRESRMDQAREMREQVRSGDVTRNEMQEQAKAHREAGQAISAAHKQMIDQVLTDEQRGKLTEMREAGQQRRSGQAGMRGRGQRGGQQGFRGARGHRGGRQSFRRSGRGRGGHGGPPFGGGQAGDGLG